MSAFVEDYQTGRIVLGRYRLVLPLAKGGQGIVYLARGEGAAGFTRPVVIKRVLTPIAKDPETVQRFVQEARVTAQLRHPDIVSILDFEKESDNTYVMVLEYVHGYDLARWSQFLRGEQRSWNPQLAAYITMRVLEALHYSHTLRAPDGEPTPIVHRDVSPGNVLIDEEGHVKLTDFGIAHTKVQRGEESTSTKFSLQGKLAYLSPELYRGALPSPQSDLYAAALVLHQMLLGKNEFYVKDLASAALRATTHVPTRVCDVRSDVSAEASDVIAQALAKDPAERFKTARELALALRRAFQLDLGELPELLKAEASKDFHDARFASLVDVMPLSEIDRAWRQAPHTAPLSASSSEVKPPPLPSARRTSSMPTVADVVPTAVREADKSSARSWLLMSGAALVVAGAAAFVALQLRKREDHVVFVDKQSARAAAAEAVEAPLDEPSQPTALGTPEPAASSRPATSASATPATDNSDPTRKLTRAFGARRRDIEVCFTTHSAALSGAPRLQVDFEVSAQGKVTEVHIDPVAVEGTDLGRCLLGVAKSTRFGMQASSLRFRIPLTARSQ